MEYSSPIPPRTLPIVVGSAVVALVATAVSAFVLVHFFHQICHLRALNYTACFAATSALALGAMAVAGVVGARAYFRYQERLAPKQTAHQEGAPLSPDDAPHNPISDDTSSFDFEFRNESRISLDEPNTHSPKQQSPTTLRESSTQISTSSLNAHSPTLGPSRFSETSNVANMLSNSSASSESNVERDSSIQHKHLFKPLESAPSTSVPSLVKPAPLRKKSSSTDATFTESSSFSTVPQSESELKPLSTSLDNTYRRSTTTSDEILESKSTSLPRQSPTLSHSSTNLSEVDIFSTPSSSPPPHVAHEEPDSTLDLPLEISDHSSEQLNLSSMSSLTPPVPVLTSPQVPEIPVATHTFNILDLNIAPSESRSIPLSPSHEPLPLTTAPEPLVSTGPSHPPILSIPSSSTASLKNSVFAPNWMEQYAQKLHTAYSDVSSIFQKVLQFNNPAVLQATFDIFTHAYIDPLWSQPLNSQAHIKILTLFLANGGFPPDLMNPQAISSDENMLEKQCQPLLAAGDLSGLVYDPNRSKTEGLANQMCWFLPSDPAWEMLSKIVSQTDSENIQNLWKQYKLGDYPDLETKFGDVDSVEVESKKLKHIKTLVDDLYYGTYKEKGHSTPCKPALQDLTQVILERWKPNLEQQLSANIENTAPALIYAFCTIFQTNEVTDLISNESGFAVANERLGGQKELAYHPVNEETWSKLKELKILKDIMLLDSKRLLLSENPLGVYRMAQTFARAALGKINTASEKFNAISKIPLIGTKMIDTLTKIFAGATIEGKVANELISKTPLKFYQFYQNTTNAIIESIPIQLAPDRILYQVVKNNQNKSEARYSFDIANQAGYVLMLYKDITELKQAIEFATEELYAYRKDNPEWFWLRSDRKDNPEWFWLKSENNGDFWVFIDENVMNELGDKSHQVVEVRKGRFYGTNEFTGQQKRDEYQHTWMQSKHVYHSSATVALNNFIKETKKCLDDTDNNASINNPMKQREAIEKLIEICKGDIITACASVLLHCPQDRLCLGRGLGLLNLKELIHLKNNKEKES